MKNIFLFLLLSAQLLQGQQVYDSLELQLAKAKQDTVKLDILHELVTEAFSADINRALGYAKRGVALADEVQDKNWQPRFYEMQGRMHANLMQLDSAMLFFNKAMTGYMLVNNRKGQATTYFKMAWVYKKKGEVDKAMEADLNALKIMEGLGDKKGISGAYNRVAEDLTYQQRLTEALGYAKKSIVLCEQNNFKIELISAIFTAGNIAIAAGKNQEALDYYERTIALSKDYEHDKIKMCDYLNAHGNALKRLGKYKEALEDYQQALATGREANYPQAISATIANLGEVNLLMGNYQEALGYQLETVRLQEKDKDLSNLTENYQHVSTIYEKLGDYKSALAYDRKAFLIRDSFASVKSDEAMSKMLTQYETKKKEETIKVQEQQLSQQRLVQWLSIGVLVLLAGFLIFGYRSYRSRTKANKLLAARNAENVLLLKEIHHRVKNNLEVVSSLLALQSAQIDDPNTKDAMQEGQNRVQSIGIVHQKLYQGENLGAIEMKDYFLNLGESIVDSFGAAARVNIELAMDKLDVDIDTAVPLGLIVNELLTNTLKYAFPQGEKGTVVIKLHKLNDGVLLLEVSDNGVGKSGETKGTGFGGQLILLLTKQLDGSMKEEINNGTHVYFEFKRNKVV